jgi:hypothetical protein
MMQGVPAGTEPPPKPVRVMIALKGEVKDQCWRAGLAGIRLQQALGQKSLDYFPADSAAAETAVVLYKTSIWTDVHTILSAAGIIGRILFPKRVPAEPVGGFLGDRTNIDRLIEANKRAVDIWKTWTLPPKERLRALRGPGVRNAIEHVENGAPEWFGDRDEFPLGATAMGTTPKSGHPSGAKGMYRFLFIDTLRVKVGSNVCDLKAILSSLKDIQDTLPTKAGIQLQMPLNPWARLPDGRIAPMAFCLWPLTRTPPEVP